jgi:hypothetical protein
MRGVDLKGLLLMQSRGRAISSSALCHGKPRRLGPTLKSPAVYQKIKSCKSLALIRRGAGAQMSQVNLTADDAVPGPRVSPCVVRPTDAVSTMTGKNPEPIRYTDQISFRATTPLRSAVASAASAKMTSINSWLRDAVLQKLAAEGRALPTEREAA